MKKKSIEIIKEVVKIEMPDSEMGTLNGMKLVWKNRFDQEVTEKRKADLKRKLDAIPDIEKKKEFLKLEIINYQQNLPVLVRWDSGSILKELNSEALLLWDSYLNDELRKLQVISNEKEKKEHKITGEIFALFAMILHHSDVFIKGSESAEDFLLRVEKNWKFKNVTIRRQDYKAPEPNLSDKKTKEHLQIINEKLLPILSEEEKEKIEKYIDNKMKIYG